MNNREARFQWDITGAMTAHGWKAGRAGGYDRKGEDVSELELPHYRLTKREAKRLRLEMAGKDYGLTSVSDVRSGKPHDPEKQRLAEIIDRHNDLNGVKASDKLRFSNCVTGHQGSRKVSMPLLEDEETGRVLIIKLLAGRSGRNEQPGK